MMLLNSLQLNEESFVEDDVISMKVDQKNKYMDIEINGGCLDSGEYLQKTKITISDWYDLKVNILDDEKNKFVLVEASKQYGLDKIIQFHLHENELKLVGFGKNGGWLEWTFIKPEVTIYGEIEQE